MPVLSLPPPTYIHTINLNSIPQNYLEFRPTKDFFRKEYLLLSLWHCLLLLCMVIIKIRPFLVSFIPISKFSTDNAPLPPTACTWSWSWLLSHPWYVTRGNEDILYVHIVEELSQCLYIIYQRQIFLNLWMKKN